MALIEQFDLTMGDPVPKVRRTDSIQSFDSPQLDDITSTGMQMSDGYAMPGSEPELGISWDLEELKRGSMQWLTATIR